ncbi:UDP-N-acetylmuramoyl-L-alanine--D-glutamate ligase [Phocicoccus pinnipedialis]|uniref:UDP-N-acetylmuramoylalanine--D-glutamate ligase n=1 Tax=Phocicoccus pinnipedialis TaxID=110845 RepID=A0A6V7RH28_9BACL|nr:UDP-N-acetylmuramoyl-L-alanine--D-glutamate ligase [Jeotgalicoccus pinnipedialis]MBP1939038.1 UDP-N-acetylmuramoylalanine--D-glutamate ligase [Jeotgalicoccus pinnipedialis]CAD2077058.1 UDP-N-acetylmuramoylalanine--D-glutamate ligase [Jeotgalicoccus pinnipedialis]
MNRYKDKNIIVLGYGRSGRSAVNALNKLGARVTLTTNENLVDDVVLEELRKQTVQIVDGHHPSHLLNDADLIVKNPGIPYRIPFLQEALERKVPIITEVELAYELRKKDIIGITGTNGKTTVTTLIGEMLTDDIHHPILCGNIGYPAAEAVLNNDDEDLVMELSSFQLMGIIDFKPSIAVITNIYDAHLDYHTDATEYRNAKLNLLKNMKERDVVIFNYAQRDILNAVNCPSEIKYFSIEERTDAYVEAGKVYVNGKYVIDVDDIVLKGPHNLENILASLLVADEKGVPMEHITNVLTTFKGIEHRLEFVGDKNGVKYYNDSKATNALATTFALRSFERDTIWIAGGLDRGQDFIELTPYLEHVKYAIVFGETKHKLAQFLSAHKIQTVETENPNTAVKIADELSNEGDVVLFSPACASWDQYTDFETRGNHFKEGFDAL